MQEFGQSDLTIIFQNVIARLWQIHASLQILRLRQENWTRILSSSWEILKVRFSHSDLTRILPRLPLGSDKSLVMLPCKIWPW